MISPQLLYLIDGHVRKQYSSCGVMQFTFFPKLGYNRQIG